MIFHFSGIYESGELKQCEEGEFVWLTLTEMKEKELFPSVREIIDDILESKSGTVFLTCEYDDAKERIVNTRKDVLNT